MWKVLNEITNKVNINFPRCLFAASEAATCWPLERMRAIRNSRIRCTLGGNSSFYLLSMAQPSSAWILI